MAGKPDEDVLYLRGIGRTTLMPDDDGIWKTLRLITFLHETAHYVHDLSLGYCMQNDFWQDEAAGALFSALKRLGKRNSLVSCP